MIPLLGKCTQLPQFWDFLSKMAKNGRFWHFGQKWLEIASTVYIFREMHLLREQTVPREVVPFLDKGGRGDGFVGKPPKMCFAYTFFFGVFPQKPPKFGDFGMKKARRAAEIVILYLVLGQNGTFGGFLQENRCTQRPFFYGFWGFLRYSIEFIYCIILVRKSHLFTVNYKYRKIHCIHHLDIVRTCGAQIGPLWGPFSLPRFS